MGYMRQGAETIFAVFPLLAVGITPILGNYVDHKGKAATMLVLGSVLLIACHLTFAFVLPMFKGNAVGGVIVAYATILVLGASFSLVPASLWPSVPKLVDAKIIGSAYALIFWIQNIGLWLFPMLIGKVLDATNPELVDNLKNGVITAEQAAVSYDYTAPLVMLAGLGVAALLLGFVYLLIRRVISWHIPTVFIATVFALSFVLEGFNAMTALSLILSGGLFIGAIFMATDYVTSPASAWGKVIFGVGAGLLTIAIRYWGNYPEGVSFAILFMNILTPYIDSWTRHKVFGTEEVAKA
jgi:Na+-translocating ferredoxin:NAD+ oxidoreductase RnfD subunit